MGWEWTEQPIVKWVLRLFVIWLSYKCNTHEPLFLRIIFMLLSVMFYQYYLIYYFIYHRILVQPCVNAFGDMGVIYR